MKSEIQRRRLRVLAVPLVMLACVAGALAIVVPSINLGRSMGSEYSPYATVLRGENLAISGSATIAGQLTVGSCVGCGGGGGSNTAGSNVMPKSLGAGAGFGSSSIIDTTTQTTIGHQLISTTGGSNDGNACGQAVSSEWIGAACWNYSPTLNDGIHDIIDIEWGTVGSGASNSTEQIPFVTHVQGNVDTTAAPSQAFAYQGSVHPTKSAGANTLTCAAFQGGASGCDLNYSFKGNGGDIINADGLSIGGATLLQLGLSVTGGAVSLGDSTHDTTINRELLVTGPSGALAVAINAGASIVAGALGGATTGYLRALTGNGQDGVVIGYVSGGPKDWSLYPSSGDLKLFEYTTDRSGGGNDRLFFKAGGDIVKPGNGHIRTAGTGVTLTNATCSSTTCTDIAGTVTTSSTTMTITFATTYTGADDADCILQEIAGTVVPTFTTSATALTASVVVSGVKYHYMCLGH